MLSAFGPSVAVQHPLGCDPFFDSVDRPGRVLAYHWLIVLEGANQDGHIALIAGIAENYCGMPRQTAPLCALHR